MGDGHGELGLVAQNQGGHMLIPAPLEMPERPAPVYERRSDALLVHARAKKEAKRVQHFEQDLRRKLQESQTTMNMVVCALPGAAPMLALSASAVGRNKNNLEAHDLTILVHSAFLPLHTKLNVGMKRKRLVTAVANTLLARQATSLETLLRRGREHRESPRVASSFVACSYTH